MAKYKCAIMNGKYENDECLLPITTSNYSESSFASNDSNDSNYSDNVSLKIIKVNF